jgi:trehalose 6-phosphate synthase/phosphatase
MELTDEKEKELLKDYLKSRKRLIFLDYDGTLVRFFDRPEDAKPTDEILDVLEKLASDEKNEVVLISGRSREDIDDWFDIDMSLAAGHGTWLKEKGGDWKKEKYLSDDWKEEVRPIFEKYVDTTPSSFIEEKDFSLAWHFRMIEPDLALERPRELVEELKFMDDLNLQLMQVNEVIEVMDACVDKSTAALHFLEKKEWDFILAMGDDWTDEDTFSVLPEDAYTLKVGARPSQARFTIDSPPFVLKLLKKLADG